MPEALRRLSGLANVLEVRADLLGDLETDWLRDSFSGELLYTLRSREEGGSAVASPERRRQRLAKAARHYDWVDLEGQRDAHPDLLRDLPPEKRIISWHGPPAGLSQLNQVLEELTEHEAHYYKIVPEARRPHDEIAPLALLRSQGRSDLIAFASGPIGTWSRLIAARLGAAVIFGAAGDEPAAPGQLALQELREDYGLPELTPVERLFGVVGCPVNKSLSPRLHNGIYRRLGIEALYLPFHVEAFGDYWLEVVESGSLPELGIELQGLSVTAPHKEVALAVAGATSPLAERIGSANSLVWRQGVWEAETTDPEGVLGPLRRRGWNPRGRAAAVLGAGGAGRAVAFALSQAGAEVCLVTRDIERGKRAARELGVSALPWADFESDRVELVVHATPLGQDAADEPPFDVSGLQPDATVIDLVYHKDRPTRLVREARQRGCTAVDGREVLLAQALPQFQLMTGEEMPADAARELLGLEA
jgi:3-dehydroquinate dehydratase/shikimate dehydrogenase